MKILLAKLIKRIFTALLGKKMAFWGAEYMSSLTDNLVDDNIVQMLKAADKNEPDKIIEYAQNAIDEAVKLIKD